MRSLRSGPILAFVLTALAAGTTWGADWAAVPTGDGNQHFYDRSKVFVSGDEVMYWRRVVFSTAHPVKNGFARSAMYRERIQCKQARITTLGYLLYASDGSVLENVYSPDAEPAAVVPETVGDRFQRVMCALNATGGEAPASPAKEPAAKKAEKAEKAEKSDRSNNSDEIRQEIDRLEQMLKRLREKLGER